jgi:hypothetical protein
VDPILREARLQGVSTTLSPVLKSPEEIRLGSPLFLDMVDDARILYDRDRFLSQRINLLRERLAHLGARSNIDFIPTEEYDREDALRAMADAEFVCGIAARVIPE